MTWVPLKRVADVAPSNVDKLTIDGEAPVRLVNYTDVYYGDRITLDMDFMQATATPSEVTKFRVEPGDVIMTKDSETAGDIGVSAFVESSALDLVCGYHLSLVRPRKADGRYLHYAISSTHARNQMSVAATGVTRFGLRSESVESLSVWVPSIQEQRAIADYLDSETARIDSLITKKRRMIELLDEQHAAQTDDLVWCRDADTAPLMRLVDPYRKVMYGIVLPGPDVEDGVLLVKGGNVKPGRLRPEALARTTREIEAGFVRSRLVAGDLVFAIRGGVGDVEEVPQTLSGANITQDVARISPGRSVSRRYLLHALRAPKTQRQVEARITGATIRGINIWELERLPIPIVDMARQHQIADRLDALLERHSRLKSAELRQARLLSERRQALITAAVTGELVLPGAAA